MFKLFNSTEKKTLTRIMLICFLVIKCGFIVCFYFSLLLMDSFAEGRARISFKEVFLPKLSKNREIMNILQQFDIHDIGMCQVNAGREGNEYDYPCVFPAKLRNDSGVYKYILVVDYVDAIGTFRNKYIAGSARVDPNVLGVAIWPARELSNTDP